MRFGVLESHCHTVMSHSQSLYTSPAPQTCERQNQSRPQHCWIRKHYVMVLEHRRRAPKYTQSNEWRSSENMFLKRGGGCTPGVSPIVSKTFNWFKSPLLRDESCRTFEVCLSRSYFHKWTCGSTTLSGSGCQTLCTVCLHNDVQTKGCRWFFPSWPPVWTFTSPLWHGTTKVSSEALRSEESIMSLQDFFEN